MLKMGGRGKKNGKPVELMIIGLSHDNLARLKEGRPISFTWRFTPAADFGCSGSIEMLIFSGETEQSMMREMHEFIGPDTELSISPKLRT